MAEDLDPYVRVVVLNWNSAWYTRRCLDALAATEYPADRVEVVLVDNGSVDGSLERLRDWFPDVRVVANGANLGFAEGCNRAMRDRDGVDAVALINNDAVPSPGWLRPLVDALGAAADIGAASSALVLEPGFVPVDVEVDADGTADVVAVRVDGADVTGALRFDGFEGVSDAAWPLDITYRLNAGAGRIWIPAGSGDLDVEVELTGTGAVEVRIGDRVGSSARPGTATLRSGLERTRLINGLGTARNERCEGYDRLYGRPVDVLDGMGADPVPVDGFCGGAVLLRSRMLDSVGLFDPRLFAYYEDTDLSWRATRAGWRIVAVPASRVEHAFGASGGSRARGFFHLDRRNWWLTAERNGTPAQRTVVRREVRREIRTALRANIAGRLKRRHLPSLQLLSAWARIVADHTVEVRRRNHPVVGPTGMRPTDRVVGRFQPRPAPSLPRPRPWGPLAVALDVTPLVAEWPTAGWDEGTVTAGWILARSLLQDHAELDPLPVVADDGARVATPAEVAIVLGVAAPLIPPRDGPISVTDHDRIGLRLVPDATAGRLAVEVTPVGGGPSRRVLVDRPAGDPGEAEPVIAALREAVSTEAHRR